jgi:hypothetical protein
LPGVNAATGWTERSEFRWCERHCGIPSGDRDD